MTHDERLALIYAPMPHTRVVHSVKRWAGVFVDDYFGEHTVRAERLRERRAALATMSTDGRTYGHRDRATATTDDA